MTLVSKIKDVLELPREAGVNKDEAVKGMLESYRKKYPLLEEAIQGKTTFEGTYKPLVEKYEGVKWFLLPKWITKYEKKLVKENREIVDPNTVSDGYNGFGLTSRALSLTTPLSLGLLFGVLFGLGPMYPHPPIWVYGLVWGSLPSFFARQNKNSLKRDLKVLDEQINKIYRGKKK